MNPPPLKDGLVGETLKDPSEFNFLSIVHSALSQKSDQNGFLRYYAVYQFCGRRFAFSKRITKQMLGALEHRGLIKKKKRGIQLIGGNT